MESKDFSQIPEPRDGELSVFEKAAVHRIAGTEQDVHVAQMRTRPVRLGKRTLEAARTDLFPDILKDTEAED